MAADRKTGTLAELMIGTWMLESRIDRAADGTIRNEPTLGSDPMGMLTYTLDCFAAQFMRRVRSTAVKEIVVSSGQNNTTAVDGYDAYFGTYKIRDDGVVLYRLEAALTYANVGLEVARTLIVNEDKLTIVLQTTTTALEPVTRTLSWKRVA